MAETGPRGRGWAGAKGKEGEWRLGRRREWAEREERKGGRKKELFLGCLEFGKFWRDANGFEFKL